MNELPVYLEIEIDIEMKRLKVRALIKGKRKCIRLFIIFNQSVNFDPPNMSYRQLELKYSNQINSLYF